MNRNCKICGTEVTSHEHIAMGCRELGASTAQARLGSGCVCAEGCESCTRLAEAFEAMRDTLLWFKENAQNMVNHPKLYSSIGHHIKEARIALELAEGVKRGR